MRLCTSGSIKIIFCGTLTTRKCACAHQENSQKESCHVQCTIPFVLCSTDVCMHSCALAKHYIKAILIQLGIRNHIKTACVFAVGASGESSSSAEECVVSLVHLFAMCEICFAGGGAGGSRAILQPPKCQSTSALLLLLFLTSHILEDEPGENESQNSFSVFYDSYYYMVGKNEIPKPQQQYWR